MARNLDLTALRSFVTVADAGGVTKAAGILNLTQSAVSMQLKRLEDGLGVSLLDRSARQIGVTAQGEQLLSYARRMLALNDEAYQMLTAQDYQGEITLGVPHDIIYPYIPPVLRKIAADFPRMQVKLVSAPTKSLREMFDRGEVDLIVTTEDQPGTGGETLVTLPLMWVGAVGGQAWRNTPLPVAFCRKCIFSNPILIMLLRPSLARIWLFSRLSRVCIRVRRNLSHIKVRCPTPAKRRSCFMSSLRTIRYRPRSMT